VYQIGGSTPPAGRNDHATERRAGEVASCACLHDAVATGLLQTPGCRRGDVAAAMVRCVAGAEIYRLTGRLPDWVRNSAGDLAPAAPRHATAVDFGHQRRT
jgi:hypothetical protein